MQYCLYHIVSCLQLHGIAPIFSYRWQMVELGLAATIFVYVCMRRCKISEVTFDCYFVHRLWFLYIGTHSGSSPQSPRLLYCDFTTDCLSRWWGKFPVGKMSKQPAGAPLVVLLWYVWLQITHGLPVMRRTLPRSLRKYSGTLLQLTT